MNYLENYFANNYVNSKNKDINKCIASAVKGNKNCDLEPINNYLYINEKMFKRISDYKKSHEKLKIVMNKLYTCPLVKGAEKEAFKKGFSKLSVPGNEIRFITLLLKYIKLIRAEHKIYKKQFEELKKATYKGPYMNGGIFKSPDEKYLLGLIIAPLKEKHKKYYTSLTSADNMTKKSGIAYTSAMKGDILYGIGYKGKDFTIEKGIPTEVVVGDTKVNKHFPFEGKETFINIPKKSNEMVYVILIVVVVFLFYKLKK
jgi:hypothetical protein